METANVKTILGVLWEIWRERFKLDRDPSELCPECLEQGDLNYMIPFASKVLGRNHYRISYQCKDCGYETKRDEFIDRD